MQLQRYRIKYNNVQGQLKNLEDQLIPIIMLSTQQSAKYWFFKSSNHKNLGFVLGLGKYLLIQKADLPAEQEIMRHIAICPTSSLVNLPLSIYHLIQWAHKIGCDDKMLMNILIIFLAKHKHYLLEILNAHKSNLNNFITQIGYHIDTAQEKLKAKEFIYAFYRLQDESFSASISRLEAVVNFFIGLDQIYSPEEYQNLNEEVIKTVSHYLMSRKCSKQYGLWTKEKIQFGLKMNRQEIF